MSRHTGRRGRGAGHLERILRAARALNRQLDAAERTQLEITEPEKDCE